LNTKFRSSQLGAVSPLTPFDAIPETTSTPFTIASGTSTSAPVKAAKKAKASPKNKATSFETTSTIKDSRIYTYNDSRDRGDKDSTSRMSPYLSAGVISVRECVRGAMNIRGVLDDAGKVVSGGGAGRWVMELAWRDFYTCILAAFPRVSMGRPFNEKYAAVKWEEDEERLRRWQEGKTGVPIVDAAMRQMNSMGESEVLLCKCQGAWLLIVSRSALQVGCTTG
jgi:deoxyribodipyrimidine photo-lyase